MIEPRLAILPPAQRRLWPELQATPGHFILYGGTALALRLAHRSSEDFDFFSSQPFDAERLLARIPYLKDAKVLQRDENTLTCLADRDGPVRVSFFGGLTLNHVRSPQRVAGPGLLVASLLDLGATKAQVVQGRALAKDYLDLEALMRVGRVSLGECLGAANAVYGPGYNPMLTLKALSFYGDGDLREIAPAVRDRLTRAAAELDAMELPKFRPMPGLLPGGAPP